MISRTEVQTEGQRKIKSFLVVFRWLSVFLGLFMASFSTSQLPNQLPQFLVDMPFIVTLVLLIYHVTASFVLLKFDDNRFNIALLITMDAIAGGFMSFYFGMPYFFAAVLLPALEAAFYFDSLISMVTGLVTTIFFTSAIAVPLIKILQDDPLRVERTSFIFSTLGIFVFAGTSIFIIFKWFQNYDYQVQEITRRFQEEKHMLFDSHQLAKKEYLEIASEIESKDELIRLLEEQAGASQAEKEQMQEELEKIRQEIDDLEEKFRKTISENTLTSNALKNLQQELEKKEAEYSEKLAGMDDEYLYRIDEIKQELEIRDETINEQEELIREYQEAVKERDTIIDEQEETFRKVQELVVNSKLEYSGRIKDLEQKISLMVTKTNQMNQSLQAKDTLLESYLKINGDIAVESAYPSIVNESVKLVRSQTAILFVEDKTKDGKILYAEAAATPYKNLFVDYTAYPDEGLIGWVYQTREPLVIHEGELTVKPGTNFSTLVTNEKSAVLVPLIDGNKCLGVLYHGNPDPGSYRENDIEMLQSFSRLAASVVRISRDFENAAQTVLTEPDTGLYNDAYFFERFAEEMNRAVRYKIPFSLIILEIENYKQFAEKAEKIVQEKVIKNLSEILKTNIRDTDIAARLADNRFAILFIHSEKSDTVMVSERIRMSAEMRTFGKGDAKKANLHMSIGIASYPDDCDDRDNLYNLALKCVEDARKKGGNQTVFIPEK
jgi:diguanylate cyclase (GGDEF)-like protein